MQPTSHQVSLSLSTLVGALALGLAVWFAPLVANFASLSLLALILAASLGPLAKLAEQRLGLKREAAVTAVFLGMLAVAVVVTLLVVPTVVEQAINRRCSCTSSEIDSRASSAMR